MAVEEAAILTRLMCATPTGRKHRWRLASMTYDSPTSISQTSGAQGVGDATSADQQEAPVGSGRRCAETTRRGVAPRPDRGRALVCMIGRAAMVHANELRLMASGAAMAQLHLFGGFDPAVGSLPPAQAHKAPTTRPALLVDGFGGTKASWDARRPNPNFPRPDC